MIGVVVILVEEDVPFFGEHLMPSLFPDVFGLLLVAFLIVRQFFWGIVLIKHKSII